MLLPAYSRGPRMVCPASSQARIHRRGRSYRYVRLTAARWNRLLHRFLFRRSHSTLPRSKDSGSHSGFPPLTDVAAIPPPVRLQDLLHNETDSRHPRRSIFLKLIVRSLHRFSSLICVRANILLQQTLHSPAFSRFLCRSLQIPWIHKVLSPAHFPPKLQ